MMYSNPRDAQIDRSQSLRVGVRFSLRTLLPVSAAWLILLCGIAPAANILRNSTFLTCSNPGIPDWWSDSRGATELNDWPACWRPDAETAIPGIRSLRMFNPEPRSSMFVQSYGYSATPGKSYTWSIYLKTDTPGDTASLNCSNLANATLKPTADWQRFTGTGVCKKGTSGTRFWLTISWGAKGMLWVCAPQLEEGDHATDYAPSPLDAEAGSQRPAKGSQPAAASFPKWPIPESRCPVLASAPKIDGKLTDEAWRNAAKLSDFILYDSDQPAVQQTEVLISRDAANLYLGIRCVEPKIATVINSARGVHDAPVFLGDDIEVFISPFADGKNYRQFALNPAGARFEGSGIDASWDGPWQSAVSEETGAWTAEIAIPFADLAYGPGVGDIWRLNICRHRAQEPEEYSTWSRVFGKFHQPTRFGKLSGMSGPDLQNWQVSFSDLKEKNGELSVGVWSAERREGRLETVDAKGAVEQAIPIRLTAGERAVSIGERNAVAGNAIRLRFVDASGKTIAENSFALAATITPSTPLQAWLTRNFYTNAADVKIMARVNRPRCRVTVSAPGVDKPIAAGVSDSLGWVTLASSLGTKVSGHYPLQVALRSADGNTVATQDLTAVILPPAPEMVPWDPASGALFVHGNAILPFAMGAQATLPAVRDIAAAGFNAATLIFRHTMTDAEVKTVLDECQRLGLGVIFWDHTGELKYPEAKEKILHWCQLFRDHPAILAWKTVDEPEGWWEGKVGTESDLKDLHDAVAAADPYHANFINHWEWKVGYGAYGGLAAADVYSVDRYPIGRQPFNDAMNNLASLFDRMNTDARHDGKPVHFWLQMYGSYDSPREPTPQEEACQTWLALIHGVRMISYFIYKPMSVDLWRSMRGLEREVTALAPLFATPELTGAVSSDNPAVHCAAFRYGDAYYLVTVNATDAPVKTRLSLHGIRVAHARALFENRGVRTDGRSLSDQWKPMERHLYELTTAPVSGKRR